MLAVMESTKCRAKCNISSWINEEERIDGIGVIRSTSGTTDPPDQEEGRRQGVQRACTLLLLFDASSNHLHYSTAQSL